MKEINKMNKIILLLQFALKKYNKKHLSLIELFILQKELSEKNPSFVRYYSYHVFSGNISKYFRDVKNQKMYRLRKVKYRITERKIKKSFYYLYSLEPFQKYDELLKENIIKSFQTYFSSLWIFWELRNLYNTEKVASTNGRNVNIFLTDGFNRFIESGKHQTVDLIENSKYSLFDFWKFNYNNFRKKDYILDIFDSEIEPNLYLISGKREFIIF